MSKPISELTYKIVAFAEIQLVDTNESIDWAVEMIELGYESPTLFMLASFNKPTNYFEVIDYVTAAVYELGLYMKSGDAAVLSYASYYIHQIAKGHNVRAHLASLYDFYFLCRVNDSKKLIFDFYLLYWAWDSLDYDDSYSNHYWVGATKATIEQIVIAEASKWIEINKDHYTQQAVSKPTSDI